MKKFIAYVSEEDLVNARAEYEGDDVTLEVALECAGFPSAEVSEILPGQAYAIAVK